MTKQEFIANADIDCPEGTCQRCEDLRKALDELIQQAIAEEKEKTCKWKYNEDEVCYNTCSLDLFVFNYTDDPKKDFSNMKYKYCPYCGGLIIIEENEK